MSIERLPQPGERTQLIGKITGEPAYKEKFAREAARLREIGADVFNPAELPDDHSWTWYMEQRFTSLCTRQSIFCLDNWIYSCGAKLEYMFAQELGLMIYPDLVPMYICDPIRARECGKEHCYIRLWGTDKQCVITPIEAWARLTPGGEPIIADAERMRAYKEFLTA